MFKRFEKEGTLADDVYRKNSSFDGNLHFSVQRSGGRSDVQSQADQARRNQNLTEKSNKNLNLLVQLRANFSV